LHEKSDKADEMKSSSIQVFALIIAMLLLVASCAGRRGYHKPKKRKMAPCDCPTFGQQQAQQPSSYIIKLPS
jgi:hypothetical protein